MRYAVLSDIHSNLEALTAVLDALASERIDRYLCLGDAIGYGADPSACLERLQACEAVAVSGNHELGCLGTLDLDWFHEAAKAAILWTRDHLSFTELNLLRRWPLKTAEGPCTLVHATLRHPERFEYLIDAGQAVETLAWCQTPFCLAGHTHLPCVVEYDRASRQLVRVITQPQELADVTLTGHSARRVLVNPGSIGQPRDGDPRASVAVIDEEARRVSIHRVAYDVTAAQQKIRQAGLPGLLADRLAVGR
ncbi:MAG: metallophosphoesterase family protein [Candidatus Omnitrophica bacterium]|nr:metallophosphoesterase family protein [Candidatus Omnitrophota bacterium]